MKKLLSVKILSFFCCFLLSAFCFQHCAAQSKLIFSNDFEDWWGDEPEGWIISPWDVYLSQYTPAASGNYGCKVENSYAGGTITLTSTETFTINSNKKYVVSFAAELIKGNFHIDIALINSNTGEINYATQERISNGTWWYYEVGINVIGTPINSLSNALAITISGTAGNIEFLIDDVQLFETELDYDFLEANNIKAYINPIIPFFEDNFEAPKNSGRSTIFTSNLWLGGWNYFNDLYVAAQQFCQRGQDFWIGPISSDYKLISGEKIPTEEYLQKYNHTWKVTKEEIEYHKTHYTDPNYVMPWGIANWPAHGRTEFGESPQLAPFHDVDGNGSYTPWSGDYPKIRGDETVFFIINDALNKHTESGGEPLNMEILGMAYAYNSPDSALQNTIFLSYLLRNKSSKGYKDFYFGFWSDFDIGNETDDYVGCDTLLNLGYGYNGTKIDGSSGHGDSYGEHPPAQGEMFLNQKMNVFAYTENNHYSPTGEPTTASEFYNLLSARWNDGTPMTYGGTGYNQGSTAYTNFMFSGDPVDGTGWTEFTPNGTGSYPNAPGDRRGLISTGPFTLPADGSLCIDIALPFAKDYQGDNISSIALLKQRAKTIQQFYNNQNFEENCAMLFSIKENGIYNDKLLIYPNPSHGQFTVTCEFPIETIELYDMLGKKVFSDTPKVQTTQINTQLSKGLYIYRVVLGNNTTRSGKIVVQ